MKNEITEDGIARLIERFVFVPVTSPPEKASLGTAAVSMTKF